jgi:hypothetical protein
VRDRVRNHRAQPADQRFEYRIQHERARAGDNQIGRQPPSPPDREDDRGRRDDRPQHPVAAQPGHCLDHGDDCGVTRDQAIEAGRCAVIGRF